MTYVNVKWERIEGVPLGQPTVRRGVEETEVDWSWKNREKQTPSLSPLYLEFVILKL